MRNVEEDMVLMNIFSTHRFFSPKRTDDIVDRVKPFINTWVTVRSWHENRSMKTSYPDDDIVGFVEEFSADIPESELLVKEPK